MTKETGPDGGELCEARRVRLKAKTDADVERIARESGIALPAVLRRLVEIGLEEIQKDRSRFLG